MGTGTKACIGMSTGAILGGLVVGGLKAADRAASGTIGAGILGWAIMNAGGKETSMTLDKTAIALVTGGIVTLIPEACITTCIVVSLLIACVAATANNEHDIERISAVPVPIATCN